MISVWSETQNIIKNMQKKWYKKVENMPGALIKKLMIRKFEQCEIVWIILSGRQSLRLLAVLDILVGISVWLPKEKF